MPDERRPRPLDQLVVGARAKPGVEGRPDLPTADLGIEDPPDVDADSSQDPD